MKRREKPTSYIVVKVRCSKIKSTANYQTFGINASFWRALAEWNLKAVAFVVCARIVSSDDKLTRSQVYTDKLLIKLKDSRS